MLVHALVSPGILFFVFFLGCSKVTGGRRILCTVRYRMTGNGDKFGEFVPKREREREREQERERE